MSRWRGMCWSLVALAGLLDCGGDRSTASNSGVQKEGGVGTGGGSGTGGGVGTGGAGQGGSAGDGGATDGGLNPTDGGADDRTVDGRLELRPPPADTPRPPEVDDCNFGAPGNITALVPTGAAKLLVVGPTWVTFTETTVRECRFVGSGVQVCTYNHWLRRVPRCGGAVETLGPLFTAAFERLAQGGGYIYALSERTNELYRIKESDGAREVISACAKDVAAGPDRVIFDDCNGLLMHGPHGASSFASIVIPAATVAKLAIGTSNAYFTTEQGIGWVSLATQDRGLLAEGPPPLDVVELGADHRSVFVEWTQPDPVTSDVSYSVRRIPLAGGTKQDFGPWAQGVSGFPSIEVRGGFLYHAAPPAIVRVASDGSAPPETRVRREYDDISAYGERIYWTERGAVLTALRQSERPACIPQRKPSALKVLPSSGNFSLDDVALDSNGNPVVVGAADGVTDLGGGPLAPDTDQMILAKLDRAGNHVFSRLIPNGANAQLAVGGTGIVTVVTSRSVSRFSPAGAPLDSQPLDMYQPLVDADSQGNSFVLWSGAADRSVWLMSKNAAGAERWRRELVPASNDWKLFPWSLSAAGDGGVFITGGLNGTLDLGDGPRAVGALATVLVARFGSDGRLAWSRPIVGQQKPGDPAFGGAWVVATPNGAAVVGVTDFSIDPGTGPVVVPHAGDAYAYVIRLGADGIPTRTRLLDVFLYAMNPVVTASGELYLLTDGCPAAPPGPDGTAAMVIAKLDQSDSVLWTGRIDSFSAVSFDADARGAVVVGKGVQLGEAWDAQVPPDDPFLANFAP